jgi:RNA polymerase sigma factor (sigma-70 family)
MGVKTTASSQAEKIVDLLPVLRRIASARLSDPETVDDVVQETITRVFEVRDRLVPSVFTSYGVVTLRNVIISLERQEEIDRRHQHRIVELRTPERPDEVVLREEDRNAITAAIARLTSRDREALVAHEVTGTSLTTLARQFGSTPGAVATRLSRARAQARLDYLLTLRRIQLPTPLCRPVLLALSSGEKRRQARINAGIHLLECPTCASLSAPLLQRRRFLAAALPPLASGKFLRFLRSSTGQALAAGGTTAAIIVVSIMLKNGSPSYKGPFLVQGERVRAHAVATTEDFAGKRLEARTVHVLSVPSDEGFWVGQGPSDRVWVQLSSSGESEIDIHKGQAIGFTGSIVPHSEDFVTRVRIKGNEGRTALLRQDQHILVQADAIKFKSEETGIGRGVSAKLPAS